MNIQTFQDFQDSALCLKHFCKISVKFHIFIQIFSIFILKFNVFFRTKTENEEASPCPDTKNCTHNF